MGQCLTGGGWSGLRHWVLWPKMLYNYPGGEDRVASSGLGTHSLRESEIEGPPPPDYRGYLRGPKGVTSVYHFHWSLFLLPFKLISNEKTCVSDAASGSEVQVTSALYERLQQVVSRFAELLGQATYENSVFSIWIFLNSGFDDLSTFSEQNFCQLSVYISTIQ